MAVVVAVAVPNGRLSERPSRRPFGLPWTTASQLTHPRLSGNQDPIQAPQAPRPSDDVINLPQVGVKPDSGKDLPMESKAPAATRDAIHGQQAPPS
ncbi:hypothetical protein ADL29_10980 [Streptomyces chattanoogensis]|uniref:Uncharacterized protein n=1 Tax=Streptomyces chattanoogensis TaxID=66876 RepID=A0A0N0H1P6_9ACTN|nr:hypothetical protein ADL29_10980 [Streptomyces chattanoogensis]